jgi:hypothetical protein
MPGALDRNGQLALVLRTVARHALGQDLATLRNELAKTGDILIVDMFDFIRTESAHLAASPPGPAAATAITVASAVAAATAAAATAAASIVRHDYSSFQNQLIKG